MDFGPFWLCPPSGPSGSFYLCSLKSDCMSGQIWPKQKKSWREGWWGDTDRLSLASVTSRGETCDFNPTGADLWSSGVCCLQAALASTEWFIWRHRAWSTARLGWDDLRKQSFWLKAHIIIIYSVLWTSCRHVSLLQKEQRYSLSHWWDSFHLQGRNIITEAGKNTQQFPEQQSCEDAHWFLICLTS